MTKKTHTKTEEEQMQDHTEMICKNCSCCQKSENNNYSCKEDGNPIEDLNSSLCKGSLFEKREKPLVVIDKETNRLIENSGYIFDPNQVLKTKIFPMHKLKEDELGIGLYLPKDKDIYTKNKKLMGKEQTNTPIIITSEKKLREVGQRLIEDYKIKYGAMPSNIELRWSLPSIRKYLKQEYGKIDGLKLFRKIRKCYEKYQYTLNEKWFDIHALWDLGTYFFILFKYYPILELRGYKRTGKTKWMTISDFITFNSSGIMINPSEATLFRDTNDLRYTKYIDEAENLFRIERGKLVADLRVELINASYYYKGYVPRVEKILNRFVTMRYYVYSPTMISSINGLMGATEDRAINHITIKVPGNNKKGELDPNEDDTILKEIRDKLYIFTLQNFIEVEKIYNNLDNKTKLRDRDYQLWKPLLTIAKFINKNLYKSTIEFAEKLTQIKSLDAISEGSFEFNILKIFYETLLTSLSSFNKNTAQDILIKDLVKHSIWGDKKPYNKTISTRLDKYGFQDFKVHTNKGNVYRITIEEFKNIISPYFSSLSSLSSLHNEYNNKDGEGEVKEIKISEEKVKNKSEANDGNETSEGESVKKGDKNNKYFK